MIIRTLSAFLLSALLAAAATSQTPAKDTPKDKDSKETKIGEKSLHEWLKMIANPANPDPAMREQAVLVIASFPGAELKKDREIISKLVLARLANENDSSVRIALIDLIGAMELEDPVDPKEAPRLLAKYAIDGVSALRIHALQALGRFGPKAHGVILSLNDTKVINDPSFQIRIMVAQTLGAIGRTEAGGPSPKPIAILSETMTKDVCASVRLAALQSLFSLGPPLIEASATAVPPPKGQKAKLEPDYDGPVAKHVIDVMKGRIGGIKGSTATENDKQIELWSRLVIIRFGGDFEEQINAIASHLNDKEKVSIKLQSLELLGLMGEAAAPKIDLIAGMLKEKDPALKVAALNTLGSIGSYAVLDRTIPGRVMAPIQRVINDPSEEPEIKIAALAALSKMGEKAERARELLVKIIEDKDNLEDPTPTKIAMLQQALLTLASMGVKAQSAVPPLLDLAKRLEKAKIDRLNSPAHRTLVTNPEYIRMITRIKKELKPEEWEKLEKNHPEDQFKKFVEEAIEFINKSTPEHPGGVKKLP